MPMKTLGIFALCCLGGLARDIQPYGPLMCQQLAKTSERNTTYHVHDLLCSLTDKGIEKKEDGINCGTDCYTMSGRFHLYKGTKNVTRTGLSCKSWAGRYENVKFLTGENKYEAGNSCRVLKDISDLVSIPWCYVSTKKKWEYCDIESCDAFNGTNCFTITDHKGRDVILYNGTTSKAVSGRTCKRWESTGIQDHVHFTTGESTTEAANYCRVVVGDTVRVPLCYTATGQEVCNVRLCSGR